MEREPLTAGDADSLAKSSVKLLYIIQNFIPNDVAKNYGLYK
jgi:hypothetical protein